MKNKKHELDEIIILDSNLLKEEKTEDWVVGWSWGRNAIFVLNPENISSQSSHNGNTYNFKQLIKHELCHSFFQIFFGQSKFRWIHEGLAIYTAGQLESYRKPEKFEGFLSEDEMKIYDEAGFVIKIILDNFGKGKLFEFLQKQTNLTEFKKLNSLFQQIFKIKLDYTSFNKLLK